MRRILARCLVITLFFMSGSVDVAKADGGGSCYNVKLGNDYIPKRPENLLAKDSRYKISETKIESVRASYASSSEINISWSRWKVLDQAQETLFYDSYILYRSSDKGLNWECSTISAARFFFDLSGLTKDTDYEFALTATDGSVWAPPTYFSSSTNILKRPVQQLCIPEDFKPSVTSLEGGTLLIATNQRFGNDLLLKWTYSENNWKSFKTAKSLVWGGNYSRIEEGVVIRFSRSAKQLEVKAIPSAEKVDPIFFSIAVKGYTSAGCETQTFKVDLKKKSLVRK